MKKKKIINKWLTLGQISFNNSKIVARILDNSKKFDLTTPTLPLPGTGCWGGNPETVPGKNGNRKELKLSILKLKDKLFWIIYIIIFIISGYFYVSSYRDFVIFSYKCLVGFTIGFFYGIFKDKKFSWGGNNFIKYIFILLVGGIIAYMFFDLFNVIYCDSLDDVVISDGANSNNNNSNNDDKNFHFSIYKTFIRVIEGYDSVLKTFLLSDT